MKYLKLFEAYPPFGDYLVSDNVKSLDKVRNFIEYFKLNNSILNIWKGMLERYNEYPLKIDSEHISYGTKDGYTLRINYIKDNIQLMKKYKKNLSDGTVNVIFEGKYTWIMFEKLYLGEN